MKPTGRGLRLLLALPILSSVSIAAFDPILASISIAIIITVIYEAVGLTLSARRFRRVSIEPRSVSLRLKAGEIREFDAIIRFERGSIPPVDYSFDYRWISIVEVDPLDGSMKVRVEPRLAGSYRVSRVKARLQGRFNLLEAYVDIPLDIEVRVYPRVLPYIIEALRLLEIGLAGFVGVQPGRRRGYGTEYLESREYIPGDPVRFIDWKATARLSKLMVKEYLEDVAGGVHIVYDVKVLGGVTGDEASSLLLSTIIGLTSEYLPLTLTVKNGYDILARSTSGDPTDALKISLRYILSFIESMGWDIYEYLEPLGYRSLMDVARRLGLDELIEAFQVRFRTVDRTLPYRESTGRMVYVGVSVCDSEYIVDLAEEASRRSLDLTVLTPGKPWMDAGSLEEAYRMYESHRAILSALRKLRVRVGVKPLEVG
ncbi:MAG: DUF58 domain-containing protein [Candidatus Bathyarchaeia archaeon]